MHMADTLTPTVSVIQASSAAHMEEARRLFAEYAQSLSVDLSFQNFDAELNSLPGDYTAPHGALLLATIDGAIAGCCALRPLPDVDYPNAAEMKRLYVPPVFRGFGLGRLLTEAILDAAVMAGYQHVLLDTLDEMESARALYQELGFEEVPPYYHNPVAGSHYLLWTAE